VFRNCFPTGATVLTSKEKINLSLRAERERERGRHEHEETEEEEFKEMRYVSGAYFHDATRAAGYFSLFLSPLSRSSYLSLSELFILTTALSLSLSLSLSLLTATSNTC